MTPVAQVLHSLWEEYYAASPTPVIGFDAEGVLVLINESFENCPVFSALFRQNTPHLGRALQDELKAIALESFTDKDLLVREVEVHDKTFHVVFKRYDHPKADQAIVVAAFTEQEKPHSGTKTALEQQLLELRQINHRVDSFLRTAAHDLRLPVTNLKNFSRLLARTKGEKGREELTDRIIQAAELLEELLDGMMEIAESRNAPEEGGEWINLQEIVDEVLGVLDEHLEHAGAVIRISLDESELAYRRAFVRSIVFNLISNAIKYRCSERRLEITIASKASSNGVWLSVSDNGIGMDLAQQKDKLFKPFKRLTDEGAGKGVGLSLVKSFVEANHGEIRVESELGVGTTFRLFLRSYEPEVKQYELFD